MRAWPCVFRQAQDVLVAEIGPGHVLALQGGGDGLDPVPEGGGPLKIQVGGGLGHLRLEPSSGDCRLCL